MLKKVFAVTGVVTLMASAAFAGPCCQAGSDAKAKAKTTAKKDKNVKEVADTQPIEVRVCPMMGTPVKGEGAGSQVVGNYKVYFCCGGCKPAFNKLSAEEQQKKIQAALKIQEDAKNKKDA